MLIRVASASPSDMGGWQERVTDLGLDVVKRRWADNGEADEEDVRLRV